MPLADYSHHNEEAAMIWWQEEGKHSVHVDHYDPEDWDDDPPTLWDERDDDDYEREAKEDECESETEQET